MAMALSGVPRGRVSAFLASLRGKWTAAVAPAIHAQRLQLRHHEIIWRTCSAGQLAPAEKAMR